MICWIGSGFLGCGVLVWLFAKGDILAGRVSSVPVECKVIDKEGKIRFLMYW